MHSTLEELEALTLDTSNDEAIAKALSAEFEYKSDPVPSSSLGGFNNNDAAIAKALSDGCSTKCGVEPLTFFDDDIPSFDEISVFDKGLQSMRQSWASLQGGEDVHGVSRSCSIFFRTVLDLFKNSPNIKNPEKFSLEAITSMKKQKPGGISSMDTLQAFVGQSCEVLENGFRMGRMDQLVGLIFRLGDCSDQTAQNLIKSLESNVKMGGGCPQGIFNRLVLHCLLPLVSDIVEPLQMRSVMNDSKSFSK